MLSNLLHECRRSIQFKLFLSLTAIVALSLAAILLSQVYLVQEYFIRQAESNLRSSNYLLSRVLADPLFEHDLSLLQARLQEVQTKLPLCNFQLKDNVGTVVYKVGNVHTQSDTEFNPNSHDGCYNTVIPVVHGEDKLLGTLRMGVRTDDIAQARVKLIQESIFFALFWFTLFMLPFFVQIRRLVRPINDLSKAAHQFARGNLDYPAPVVPHGEDEVSQLTASFKEMAQALVINRESHAASLSALSNEKSTLDALLATMPVGVIFADHSHIRYCNSAFRKLCQISPQEELLGMKNDVMLLRIGQLAANAESFLATAAEVLETRKLSEQKYIALKDGRILRVTSNIVIAAESSGYLGRFWIFEDATEDQKMLHSAELRADHDVLTMLYNSQCFDLDLPRLLVQAECDGTNLALLVFDLDDFKSVTELIGRASGDDVIKKVAQSLSFQLRHHNGALYRIGGDEFAFLLVDTNEDELKILAERIVNTIRSLTFDFDGKTTKVSCSLGIARYPHDAISIQSLLQLANQAMHIVKSRGKNNWLMGQNQHKSKLAILFADICGSTSLYDKLGNESALQIINRTLSILSQEVESHQGMLIKTIGDEIMCTFANVEIAAKAACAMQLAIKDQCPGGENPIFVRIGLHYGDVIHEVSDVFGDAVNIAARVTSVTRARQIMTTQTVVDALPSEYADRIYPAMRTALRGKQDSLAVFEILWAPESMSETRIGKADFRKPNEARNELLLRYKQKVITLNEQNISVILGRDDSCDLTIQTNFASRSHLQIDYSFGKFILRDYSANGTYIQLNDNQTVQIHQQQIVLHGRGQICLGQSFEDNPSEVIEYLVQ